MDTVSVNLDINSRIFFLNNQDEVWEIRINNQKIRNVFSSHEFNCYKKYPENPCIVLKSKTIAPDSKIYFIHVYELFSFAGEIKNIVFFSFIQKIFVKYNTRYFIFLLR